MREAQGIDPQKAAVTLAEQLPKGIFLCVGGETENVMTIGWGGLSFYWGKNVYVAPIRPQRFTYPLLQKERAFTLSVPAPGAMKQELTKAGTLSGRNGNKFDAIGLQTARARVLNAPVIIGPDIALTLECVVLANNAFSLTGTDPAIVKATYAAHDFHTLFYGEIVACYGAV